MTPNSQRVAVASRSFSKHPELRRALLDRYPNTTFNDAGDNLRGQALIDFLKGHEKAITALEPLDAALFDAVPELRVVGKYGVGLDMLDLEAMRARGVKLGWTAGVNRRAVAELTLGFALSLIRRVPASLSVVAGGGWRQIPGRQLTGRTVGIIGLGNVGKDLAGLLRAFDCRILAHDIRTDAAFCARVGVEMTDLDRLLGESEIVSIHLPLDDSTRGMIGARELALMPAGAILINTARGAIVDEAALAAELKSGRLGAAAFDVFAVEPPGNNVLIGLDDFVATPHIGGSTEEAILAMGLAAIDGLDNAGDPLVVARGDRP
ncbi:MAG: phosphoglycerate dehydrogenase [Rhodospirillales bacterium CG15_BIG_FIL_POST_REV_8_21_14_020_66_15]|nr:MAG: phosphoglycerate dehydrogenase [Rhodospirillales bacterium CG15_BIG_FIL_POST_REV_8_21_14_020_66_15]